MWPEMPECIKDRDADVWEPLLAVADLAAGDWPERARVAAVTLVTLSKESTPSLGVKLLQDIRTVFDDHDQLGTKDLLHGLHSIDESPWGDLKGKPLDERGLATRLRPYEIKPTTIRVLADTRKGYRKTDFFDAWSRYLPQSLGYVEEPSSLNGTPQGVSVAPYESVTSVTSVTGDETWDA